MVETLKILVKKSYGGDREVNATEKMVCGAVSGFVAQSVTYPIDVIRRRMQTDGIIRKSIPRSSLPLNYEFTNSGRKKYQSMTRTIQYISATEGMRGFFKGVSLNWIKGPLSIAVSFTTYDSMKDLFKTM